MPSAKWALRAKRYDAREGLSEGLRLTGRPYWVNFLKAARSEHPLCCRITLPHTASCVPSQGFPAPVTTGTAVPSS